MARMPRYWLMKSEPETFSIDDLARAKDQTTFWDGVRNFQARNLLRDEMAVGDGVLFYHSSADPTAVVGTAKIVGPGRPDPSQFDRKSDHHDPASTKEAPRWFGVDIKLDRKFARPVPLPELRANQALDGMVLLRKGSRLSVQPVTPDEWRVICRLGFEK
jgi:predicted RNA-binding protein with PUA-like domain